MKPARPIPKKLFYRITEVAEILGVEAYVLRYWETRFPMLRPERCGNDERRYRRKDIDLLLRIRDLLYEQKFTIAGAVEQLRKPNRNGNGRAPVEAGNGEVERNGQSPAQPGPDTIEALRESLRDIREELLALREG